MVNSQISTESGPLDCFQPIKEQVWIWTHDPVVILWGCHGLQDFQHDEAIIVAPSR